jgi:hypothetical protein
MQFFMGVIFKMANNKTFVKITNEQVYTEICDLKNNNEKAHDEIMVTQEKLRVLLNDHLHEHQIRLKERVEREKRDRWLWGIVVTIVGIIAGFVGSLL